MMVLMCVVVLVDLHARCLEVAVEIDCFDIGEEVLARQLQKVLLQWHLVVSVDAIGNADFSLHIQP